MSTGLKMSFGRECDVRQGAKEGSTVTCTISHGSSSTPSDDCLTAGGLLYAEGGGLSGNWKLPAVGEVACVVGTGADGLPTSPLPAPCAQKASQHGVCMLHTYFAVDAQQPTVIPFAACQTAMRSLPEDD